jgi:hypothetical protein
LGKRNWTPHEKNLLVAAYRNRDGKNVHYPAELLGQHSRKALIAKANKLGLGERTGSWSDKDIEMLTEGYKKRTQLKHGLNFSDELRKNHTQSACWSKAHRLGLKKIPIHSCWRSSKIIKKELNYNISRGRQDVRGVWRFRECNVCKKGWETLELKRQNNDHLRKPTQNRLRPLSAGWKP